MDLSKLHLAVTRSLFKSCERICIVCIWVFPELADKCNSLLFVPTGLPVRYQYARNHLSVELFLVMFIADLSAIKIVKQNLFCFIFCLEDNFFHQVYEVLEIILCQRLLFN